MRTYVDADGRHEVIESDDQRARFTLLTISRDDVAEQAVRGYDKRRAELAAVIEEREAHTPEWSPAQVAPPRQRLRRSPDGPGYVPASIERPGAWVTWQHQERPVTGQVWSRGARVSTWFVTTDRSGHTGEVHVMERTRTGGGYAYRIGLSPVSMAAAGPGGQLPFEELPDVGAWMPKSQPSYAAWDAAGHGMQSFDPRPVDAGHVRVATAAVWFPLIIDGLVFEVLAEDDGAWRVTIAGLQGEPLWQSQPLPRGSVRYAAVAQLRTWESNAKRTLTVDHKPRTVTLLPEPASCPRCNYTAGIQELYQYAPNEKPLCREHLSHLVFAAGWRHTAEQEVDQLGRAQTILARRESSTAQLWRGIIRGDVDASRVPEGSGITLAEHDAREAHWAQQACSAADPFPWKGAQPGPAATVVTPRGEHVEIRYAGWDRACRWEHCQCPDTACTCPPRPVMLCDGEGQPYPWEDCPECMADTLGLPPEAVRQALTAPQTATTDGRAMGQVKGAFTLACQG